jgi:NitT/TauT family transport system ATP-binding protein
MGEASPDPYLRLEDVSLQYLNAGQRLLAAYRVNLTVAQGERLVVLGPSGCGKSSLLKAIAGFLKPVEGRISLRGREVKEPGPDRAMVFQEFDQLFPWKTVRQNLLFALSRIGMPRPEAERAARQSLEMVGLLKVADAYPHTLSGGMKQRAAIARALALGSELVLMDEPFGSLDPVTRKHMQDELLGLWLRARFTMIFVTHSIEEALLLGSRVLVLSPHPGQIVEELDTEHLLAASPEYWQLHERIHAILDQEVNDYVI